MNVNSCKTFFNERRNWVRQNSYLFTLFLFLYTSNSLDMSRINNYPCHNIINVEAFISKKNNRNKELLVNQQQCRNFDRQLCCLPQGFSFFHSAQILQNSNYHPDSNSKKRVKLQTASTPHFITFVHVQNAIYHTLLVIIWLFIATFFQENCFELE
jgi:hypothetical protein